VERPPVLLVVADQREGNLVCVVEPGFADLAVHDRDPAARLGAIDGTFCLAGQCPLGLSEVVFFCPQEPRIRDDLPV
jgi:hypothetical protein